MTFATRAEAGHILARYLKTRDVHADIVLGLPRGGVIVAREVACELGSPLDVLIVRKIGHPSQREFAVGALAEPDIILLNSAVIGADAALHRTLKGIIQQELECVQRCRRTFHLTPLADLHGQAVLLVDDGLATGATTEAAALAARKLGAARVIVATPVASGDALRRLSQTANEVIALHVDEAFEAVGRYYADFKETSDEEVLRVLRLARGDDS
jgi:predicted phosphoribosyltransferase